MEDAITVKLSTLCRGLQKREDEKGRLKGWQFYASVMREGMRLPYKTANPEWEKEEKGGWAEKKEKKGGRAQS